MQQQIKALGHSVGPSVLYSLTTLAWVMPRNQFRGMSKIAYLPDRGVVEIAGSDRVAFLQGLVSNDVTLAAEGRSVWAAVLTPQGKWLADFFILAHADALLLDCERDQAAMLVKLLQRYRLRSKVTLQDVSDRFAVHAAWGGPPGSDPGAIIAADPRLEEAGFRVLAAAPLDANATPDDWQAHRIALALPDGSRDLEPEKTILLEAGFDELGGVSWSKGCYMGQELTARTKYRGLVKRRVLPVVVVGPMPQSGTVVTRDGHDIGTMRSTAAGHALATLRIDSLEPGAPILCGEALLQPFRPSWMRVPDAVAG
jgi:folate-binding protein YgfZ